MQDEVEARAWSEVEKTVEIGQEIIHGLCVESYMWLSAYYVQHEYRELTRRSGHWSWTTKDDDQDDSGTSMLKQGSGSLVSDGCQAEWSGTPGGSEHAAEQSGSANVASPEARTEHVGVSSSKSKWAPAQLRSTQVSDYS